MKCGHENTMHESAEELWPKTNEINHPAHYNHGKIEPIDVIEDWKLNYRMGCVLKYVARHEHKGQALKDLRKMRWYLDREIMAREAAEHVSPGQG